VASEPLGVPLIDAVAHYDNGTAVFADARPLEIFKDGHIAGAYHLDVELFRQGRPDVLDLLPTDMPIIVYCGGGECDASKIVKRLLNSHGFADVLIFEEGYPAWQAAGYPVETGEPAL
jgi:rhodanese-related sulfurtransferase